MFESHANYMDFVCSTTAATDDVEPPTSQTITFPPGTPELTQMCSMYQIIDDLYKEFNETFTIFVYAENRFDIIEGLSQIVVTIIDDQDGGL